MRFAAKVDDSQRRLVPFLRALGASFRSTPALRAGEPDGIVGYALVDQQVEFKTDDANPEPHQLEWHVQWRGSPVAILRTEADVKALLALMRKRRGGRAA